MASLLRTIVIVGGGFSGVVTAANLLRRPLQGPTRIVLIERQPAVARGVAYAARSFPYLLNVPAGRMSAQSNAPAQFTDFARRQRPDVSAEDFLPRALYGEYLEEFLLAAELSAPRAVRFEKWRGHVVNVRRIDRSSPLHVELDDGRRLTADQVVLAPGNPPPASPRVAAAVDQHPAYIANPWIESLDFQRTDRVLIIGTGLTMADVVNRASTDLLHTPTLHALSRHGLVPPQQTAFRPDAFKGDGAALLMAASTSLRGVTVAVRLLTREAERAGGDWREAITFVRNMAPMIWQRLSPRDKARFLRHLRAYWDIHRHRLPPQIVQRLQALRAHARLHIHAGRIVDLAPAAAQIKVHWRPRGAAQVQALNFDRVINCTGPDYSIARSQEPLWRNLLQCGLCTPDELGLGVRTGPQGALIDADGWPGPHLFYVGPMLRADHWEATGVAELRTHAERLADRLAA